MKKITLCLLFTLSIFAAYGQEITLIDFGQSTNTTDVVGWNNVTDPTTTGVGIALNNNSGDPTGETLTLTDAFDPIPNSVGTQTPDSGLPFPDTATRDSFFGSDGYDSGNGFNIELTGGFTLSNLEAGKYYSFQIFASRMGGPITNKETLYTITGNASAETATLDAQDNEANVATILNIQPNVDGEITILVQKGSNNNTPEGFYYLGAMEMTKTDNILSNKKFGINGTVSVFPNPSSESQFVKISLNLNAAARVKMNVYDVTGKLVKTLLNEEKSAGSFVQTWDRSNVASGLYILKIDADGRNQNSKLILK